MCLLACVCAACNTQVAYENYQQIGHAVWQKEQAYSFDFQVDDSTRSYDISVEVRNNGFYPYQNLWLLCEEVQGEHTLACDTINCELADDYGKWYGQGISIFHSSFRLREGYRFPKTGVYTFRVKHGMRKEQLQGIREIGLRVAHGVRGVLPEEDKE